MVDIEHAEEIGETLADEAPRPRIESCQNVQASDANEFFNLARLQEQILWDFDGEWFRLDQFPVSPNFRLEHS
jgi:hypothetical protein